jgi:hypothetical protein
MDSGTPTIKVLSKMGFFAKLSAALGALLKSDEHRIPGPPFPLVSWSEIDPEYWPVGYTPRDDEAAHPAVRREYGYTETMPFWHASPPPAGV